MLWLGIIEFIETETVCYMHFYTFTHFLRIVWIFLLYRPLYIESHENKSTTEITHFHVYYRSFFHLLLIYLLAYYSVYLTWYNLVHPVI